MVKRDFWCPLLMGVLEDNHSDRFMAKMNYFNTETLSIVLKGLEKLYQKFDRCVCREDPKVHKTGLTFVITILVSSKRVPILLASNGHPLIIFCVTNFRDRSIILGRITRSSKSLETFLQGKMCREGVKPQTHRRISSYWQDFHFEWAALHIAHYPL